MGSKEEDMVCADSSPVGFAYEVERRLAQGNSQCTRRRDSRQWSGCPSRSKISPGGHS